MFCFIDQNQYYCIAVAMFAWTAGSGNKLDQQRFLEEYFKKGYEQWSLSHGEENDCP